MSCVCTVLGPRGAPGIRDRGGCGCTATLPPSTAAAYQPYHSFPNNCRDFLRSILNTAFLIAAN